VLGFWVTGVYRSMPIVRKTMRMLIGGTLGTAAGVLTIFWRAGFVGLSRIAFAIDLVLLLVLAVGWRAGRVLWVEGRARRAFDAGAFRLVDRAADSPSIVPTLVALFSYRELLRNLVLRDLKLKYRGSVLGFLWSLVNPLAMVGVYTVVFSYIMPSGQPRFAFFFLLGVLAWTFFSASAMMSTGAVVDSAGLIKAVRFPLAILPVASVLFNLVQYLLTVSVLLPVMMLIYRTMPTWPALLFPVFLTLQVAFTVGVALMLAAATAFYRDIRHLLEIALAMLFWMTPIVYALDTVKEPLRFVMSLTPLSPFIVAYQKIFFFGQWPELSTWLIAVTYAACALAFGAALFLSVEERLAEQL
jgi:homopolymeric O-antigen transport system permease protein